MIPLLRLVQDVLDLTDRPEGVDIRVTAIVPHRGGCAYVQIVAELYPCPDPIAPVHGVMTEPAHGHAAQHGRHVPDVYAGVTWIPDMTATVLDGLTAQRRTDHRRHASHYN